MARSNDRVGRDLRVAIVAYQGVLADESWVFHEVLGRIPRARVLIVGTERGIVGGPGGAQRIAATFDQVDAADVVVVPGGLGSHRHPEIARWLLRLEPRWVLTSSTGSALLAAAGLLRGRTAATHWLAGPLLERHGVVVSDDRLVVDRPFVSCAGLASTFDAALVVAGDIGGPSLVRAIKDEVATADRRPVTCDAPSRYRPRQGRPLPVVEVELEEITPTRRR